MKVRNSDNEMLKFIIPKVCNSENYSGFRFVFGIMNIKNDELFFFIFRIMNLTFEITILESLELSRKPQLHLTLEDRCCCYSIERYRGNKRIL